MPLWAVSPCKVLGHRTFQALTICNVNILCFLNKVFHPYRGKDQAAKDIAGRYPISHYWDSHDPKLVVCEAHILPKVENKDEKVKPRASLTKAIEEGPVSIGET